MEMQTTAINKAISKKNVLNGNDLEYFANGICQDGLFKLAVDTFKSSGIDFSLLERYKIRIFNEKRDVLKDRLGFTSFNGHELLQTCRLIEFPFFNEEGEIGHYFAYKPIPSIEGRKYLQPKNKPAIPYIIPEVWRVKNKPNKPIWFTEGIKKALSLFQHDRIPISLSGVWNFKESEKSNSSPYLFEEIESFVWNGRTVFFRFRQRLVDES